MYQTDRGNYRTNESYGQSFMHSCLGRLIIVVAVLLLILFIAHVTRPSVQVMEEEMMDNIVQCIVENDSTKTDGLDDAVNNVGFIFTTVDSASVNPEVMEAFYKYNRLECHTHAFYTTARVVNNFRPDGRRVGIGIFGVVIPTVSYSDLILQVGPIHKGYGKKLINTSGPDDYMGENPGIQEFHYKRDPRD